MNRGHLNKAQRMQLKALICILGLLLLFIILIANLVLMFVHNEPEEEPHIPVIEILQNVWVMEADDAKLLVFQDGVETEYPVGAISAEAEDGVENSGTLQNSPFEGLSPEQVREQIADIVLTDGVVTAIQVKKEKVTGKILSADTTAVELEGYGRIPLAENYKGYRIYNTLTMCTVSDLPFGYAFADFVMEDGEICGILIAKEEAMEYIRVLIKASDFSGNFHEQLEITSDTDFTIEYGSYDNRQQEKHLAGEVITIGGDSQYFQGEMVLVVPDVLTGKVILQNVNRSQGVPSYRGHMELHTTESGIVAVNEVLLEEYLYCVVPSEMPSTYPDEALQAQAVCARTYAYGNMLHAGYPQYGAHVDDSTSYQVYNNILEQETTTTAVKETYGQLLYTAEGTIANTYYYSTSCGVGTDAAVWKTEAAKELPYLRGKRLNRGTMEEILQSADRSEMTELLRNENNFAEYISVTNEDDFEFSEGWYRWNYEVKKIDRERMLTLLQQRYAANNKLVLTLQDGEYISQEIEELDEIKNLYIAVRGIGGVADELIIETKKHTYKVIAEYNIRYVLNNGESPVVRQDGSEVASNTLLPSGFFILTVHKDGENVEGYTLQGGGFGHGVGMSQNGAKNMAKSGYTADEILKFFYDGCTIRNIYEL